MVYLGILATCKHLIPLLSSVAQKKKNETLLASL